MARLGWIREVALATGVLASAAMAAPVSFSTSGGQIQLPGGGDTQWTFVGNFSTSDGTTAGTCGTTGSGLALADGAIGVSGTPKSGAFDGGLTVWVDGTLFATPDTVDVTGGALTAGPTTLSGLEVTVVHAALASQPILRTLVALRNPGTSEIAAEVQLIANLGSDAATAIRAISPTELPWQVTSDDPVTPGDAVVLMAAGGWSGPQGFADASVFASIMPDAFACTGSEGIRIAATPIIPPGQTSYMLYFTELATTNAAAVTAGDAFEGDLDEALLAGMDDDTRLRVVNWYLPGEIFIHGGGPGNGSDWFVHNQSLPSNGLPVGGSCQFGPALSIAEAVLDPGGATKNDPVDFAAMIFVDGQAFAASLHPTVTPSRYADGPIQVAGLDTTVEYVALPGSATLRTLATFTNGGGAPITATVTMATNVGSDGDTGVRASSSGDLLLDGADRWAVTSDSATTPGDPPNTHVLAGPGAVPVPPSSIASDVFDCSTTDGVRADFPLAIPPGETRALLFFHGMSRTNEQAITDAAVWDATPATTDSVLAGIAPGTLLAVANWAFCASNATLCDDGDTCTVDTCATGGGCAHDPIAVATLVSVGCRLTALVGDVQTLDPGKLRDALTRKLQAAQTAATAAEGAAGRDYKKQLRKAAKSLKGFEKRLRSKAARKAIDAAVRSAFVTASKALRADLKTLAAAG